MNGVPATDVAMHYCGSKQRCTIIIYWKGDQLLSEPGIIYVLFLEDGYVPMTNNVAECSLCPFAVGRNN